MDAYPVCQGNPPDMTVPMFTILERLADVVVVLAKAGAKACTILSGPTTLTSNIAASCAGSVSSAAAEPLTPA